jgi:hypothetical protein
VVMDSHAVLRSRPRTSPGLPGPSVSLSTRALPNHPGRLDGCGCSLLPHRYQASSPSEEWPPPVVSRGRIGFACAGLTSSLAAAVPRRAPDRRTRPDRLVSRIRLPSYAEPELHGERAIHMADTSQSARQTRVALAHRSSQRSPIPQRSILRIIVGFVCFVYLVSCVHSWAVLCARCVRPSRRRARDDRSSSLRA